MPIFTAKEIRMDKKSVLIAISALLLISGCGDSKKSETASNTPKIEIVKGAVNTNVAKDKNRENSGQFYYSYNSEDDSKEAKAFKKYEEETKKTRTTLDAYLNIHSPYERVKITMMIKRLSKDFIVRCSPCHDDYANGVIGPSLLGKDGKFIYGRLMDFKSGKRKNVLMKELVSQIDDSKLKAIADEIAEFNKQIEKMRKGEK